MPKSDSSSKVYRFWLKQGAKANIIFLTNGANAPIVPEHSVCINGTWGHEFTCLKAIGEPCPLCDYADDYNKYKAYHARMFAVYNMTLIKRKNQEVETPLGRQLLVAKFKTEELLKRRYEKIVANGDDFRGAMFEVVRSTEDKSPRVGDDYTFEKMVDLAELNEEAEKIEDYNFEEILAIDREGVKNAARRLREARKMGEASGATSGGGPRDSNKPSSEVNY